MDTTKLKGRLGEKVQGLQKSVEMTSAADTSLSQTTSNYLALNDNTLEIIRENLKNQPLSFDLFDVVKSPSGGATVFSVPGMSGDEAEKELTGIIRENLKNQPLSFDLFDVIKSPSGGSTVFSVPGMAGDEAEKELTGIILSYTTPRAYWDTPDPVEGTPPSCMSQNSIISYDGKACAHCPFNDFGSKDGESNAKACKESVLLFLLRPGSIIPLLVRVPVTSKGRFLKYATRLLSILTPISSVVTKITLEKATSRAGKPYALFNFEVVGTLSPEEAAQARTFGQQFMEIINAAEMASELAEAG